MDTCKWLALNSVLDVPTQAENIVYLHAQVFYGEQSNAVNQYRHTSKKKRTAKTERTVLESLIGLYGIPWYGAAHRNSKHTEFISCVAENRTAHISSKP